jgi:hypothetical protein
MLQLPPGRRLITTSGLLPELQSFQGSAAEEEISGNTKNNWKVVVV